MSIRIPLLANSIDLGRYTQRSQPFSSRSHEPLLTKVRSQENTQEECSIGENYEV